MTKGNKEQINDYNTLFLNAMWKRGKNKSKSDEAIKNLFGTELNKKELDFIYFKVMHLLMSRVLFEKEHKMNLLELEMKNDKEK